ncbi:hypothetical protein [Leucobacter aridicollis]|uniref:SnoaL-like domain-containing protein n=1 Tax=Leucobacter aridicollis TaxID=283878 RepID=A0A852QWE8_9MICO|nr:hypothetical protein [Leucobacter aridicollis]MBL3682257.1 hypothetical protein [Leucobacter aridicollis]NYD25671.1 hypothetical protein [Leucobacter aridicollis]
MHKPLTHHNVAAGIDRYLQLCEDRDFKSAARYWGPGDLRMTFPGGRVFDSFEALAQETGNRYRWVRKYRDRFLVGSDTDTGLLSVTSMGRLYGEDPHGEGFTDIRYVDVFTIRDGFIVEQFVWNDLAELGVVS